MYKGINVKKFFVKATKLYKEAKFNDQAKFGLTREAIKSDQAMLQLLFLRKADVYKKVREDFSNMPVTRRFFASQGEQICDQTRTGHLEGEKEKLHKETSEKVDKLRKNLSNWLY